MRLFNRRKEMEFDDPRHQIALVGIAPLKSTEETFGLEQESQKNPPTRTEERPGEGLLTVKQQKSNELQNQQDKCRMTNGISTWKRVARPWDSLRRSESTEHLSRSVMSSTTNRRKTLHFYSEVDDKYREKSLPRIHNNSEICSEIQSGTSNVPPKKKLGRVESLRMLLSKPNRMYKGKVNNNSKLDKGTDTQDLIENDLENNIIYNNYNQENDDVFSSKYSSLSSMKSTPCLLINSADKQNTLRGGFQITKTISCENLSLRNGNQGITLPGHRDMSTSTPPFLTSSCSFQQMPVTTVAKRSSFPYAYIRSRLTSLQEEPKIISPVKSSSSPDDKSQDQKQKCSLASKFMHKGFYHSMGNLLSESKEEVHQSQSSSNIESEEDVGVSSRIFDPLKQIRIDLLHKNPSEFDDQSPSPTFWGRRSYSIGDILEKRKTGKGGGADNGNGIEESGYDSDSTRNGHESPRNSIKSPSSENETENDLNESDQCTVTNNNNDDNGKSSVEAEAFDCQSQSNSETSSSSTYSFPASGCLITINQTQTEVSVNGILKGENGTMTKITSEIDQSEDFDFYSASTDGALEPGGVSHPVVINYTKSSSNDLGRNRQNSSSGTLSEVSEPSILSIRKEMSDPQKQAAPSLRLRNRVRDREWNSIKPSRSKSLCLSIFTVTFHKGPRKKSLGFSVIGGKDSPVPGIFVKRIFPYGQASEEGGLTEGDEILSVNGQPLAQSTHAEALNIFKSIKTGDVALEVARREFLPISNSQNLKRQYSQLSSKSCEQLHQAY